MWLGSDWWVVVIVHTNHETTGGWLMWLTMIPLMWLGSDWWVVVIVHTNHETTDVAKI